MANLLKQQRNELLSKAFDENPELAKGKKLCGIIALLWIITRALHLAVELILAFTIDIAILSATNIAALVIVILFAHGIYNGSKAFAILPIIGGVIMTIQIFTSHIYLMLGAEYLTIVRIYAIVFILASLAQLVLPIIVLTAKSSNLYFNTVQTINKELLKPKA
jgi:hypothetical protein